MREVFEKIIEKLEERKVRDAGIALDKDQEERCFWYKQALNKAIEIVKQAAEECKTGHFGCNSNGQHEKCSSCCDYDCKNRNREWFGVKDDNDGWIPCNERMPDSSCDVIITTHSLVNGVGSYFGEDSGWIQWYSGGGISVDVIAWKPLPAPYQPTRKNCSNRHENGNCLAVGGFCTSVDDKYCKYHKKKTNFDRCCESMEAMAQIIDIAKIGWTKEQIMEWLQKEVDE